MRVTELLRALKKSRNSKPGKGFAALAVSATVLLAELSKQAQAHSNNSTSSITPLAVAAEQALDHEWEQATAQTQEQSAAEQPVEDTLQLQQDAIFESSLEASQGGEITAESTEHTAVSAAETTSGGSSGGAAAGSSASASSSAGGATSEAGSGGMGLFGVIGAIAGVGAVGVGLGGMGGGGDNNVSAQTVFPPMLPITPEDPATPLQPVTNPVEANGIDMSQFVNGLVYNYAHSDVPKILLIKGDHTDPSFYIFERMGDSFNWFQQSTSMDLTDAQYIFGGEFYIDYSAFDALVPYLSFSSQFDDRGSAPAIAAVINTDGNVTFVSLSEENMPPDIIAQEGAPFTKVEFVTTSGSTAKRSQIREIDAEPLTEYGDDQDERTQDTQNDWADVRAVAMVDEYDSEPHTSDSEERYIDDFAESETIRDVQADDLTLARDYPGIESGEGDDNQISSDQSTVLSLVTLDANGDLVAWTVNADFDVWSGETLMTGVNQFYLSSTFNSSFTQEEWLYSEVYDDQSRTIEDGQSSTGQNGYSIIALTNEGIFQISYDPSIENGIVITPFITEITNAQSMVLVTQTANGGTVLIGTDSAVYRIDFETNYNENNDSKAMVENMERIEDDSSSFSYTITLVKDGLNDVRSISVGDISQNGLLDAVIVTADGVSWFEIPGSMPVNPPRDYFDRQDISPEIINGENMQPLSFLASFDRDSQQLVISMRHEDSNGNQMMTPIVYQDVDGSGNYTWVVHQDDSMALPQSLHSTLGQSIDFQMSDMVQLFDTVSVADTGFGPRYFEVGTQQGLSQYTMTREGLTVDPIVMTSETESLMFTKIESTYTQGRAEDGLFIHYSLTDEGDLWFFAQQGLEVTMQDMVSSGVVDFHADFNSGMIYYATENSVWSFNGSSTTLLSDQFDNITSISVADVNNDGIMDFLIGSSGTDVNGDFATVIAMVSTGTQSTETGVDLYEEFAITGNFDNPTQLQWMDNPVENTIDIVGINNDGMAVWTMTMSSDDYGVPAK